jgi:hypothetical protein
MKHTTQPRRSFLSGLQAGAAALAALALGRSAAAQSRPAAAAKFEPSRHDQDNWLDELGTRHRLIFDTVSADGFGEALLFASNFITANRQDYGVQPNELGIVIVARHASTTFAYNDAMWAKYGKSLASRSGLSGPRFAEPPKVNPFNSSDYAGALAGFGIQQQALARQGVWLAVCSMATRNIAGLIARESGGEANAIFQELGANLVTNARLVPAGIVAASRAQERGYTFIKA